MSSPALEDRLLEAVMQALTRNELPMPSLPDVALTIGRITQDSNVTAQRVADEVNKDPSISARLLRVANSAMHRASHVVTSVPQAVTRLGLANVRQLVYGLSLEGVFLSESPALNAQLRKAWTASVEVAAVTHVLATRVSGIPPETAMLGGLLHRVGVLPIIRMAERMTGLRDSAAAAERVIRTLQARVGQAILYSWHFPAELVQVPIECWDFHRSHGGRADIIDYVSVACLLLDAHRDRQFADVARERVPAFERLRLDPSVDWFVEYGADIDERLGWLGK